MFDGVRPACRQAGRLTFLAMTGCVVKLIMIDLKQKIRKEIEVIEKRIKFAAIERDESATPMESAHDQTRQIANQLYNSLLEEKKKLMEIMAGIANYQTIIQIRNLSTDTVQRYLVVPNGLGGTQEEGVVLLSEKTPLAKNLIGRKVGAEFELNGQRLKIEKIEENV